MIRFDVDSIDLFQLHFVSFVWLLSKIKVNICNPFHQTFLPSLSLRAFVYIGIWIAAFVSEVETVHLKLDLRQYAFWGLLVHALAVINVCSGKEYLAASQVTYTYGDTKFDLFSYSK